MSQQEKSKLFKELKAEGFEFDRHYREYTTEQLREAVNIIREGKGLPLVTNEPEPYEPPKWDPPEYEAQAMPADTPPPPYTEVPTEQARPEPVRPPIGRRPADVMPAANAYKPGANDETPIRQDPDTGFIWYREEVQKPAVPRPRARRKLTLLSTNVKKAVINSGQFMETFEVAGDKVSTTEVKITMPSFQVGVYRDPRTPHFKIHVYGDRKGFDYFDVIRYYGGLDFVPPTVKPVYVANDLCYDIRSVINAINQEYRERVLKKEQS